MCNGTVSTHSVLIRNLVVTALIELWPANSTRALKKKKGTVYDNRTLPSGESPHRQGVQCSHRKLGCLLSR
ncbi:hypothetical protein PF005_g15266 [Phytophthora fragariae]|uniref:Secreted protein n=2 Tax=Phytophthora TaxID=4783 RepID=A0A6A3XDH8_9STRA|nr:hypothetical protein PF009_g16463 [Phytophthora fragariae]KAE9037337.1 hypothetical protein PR002_g6624 [Phytophthora rubi]KAE8999875.1 hypothetical protein PF011_g14438 [Phytophthora fragariae]KAE9100505.1 hypothetical protein PF007_g15481 [Phytophthora fragariae]KAE9100543.1 hypothetical protein PF010_g14779 [Phytophthora fragariae]